MKKIIVFFILLLFNLLVRGQAEYDLNWIIFIDGKLIEGLEGEISYTDKKDKLITINYKAILGEVFISKNAYEALNEQDPKTRIKFTTRYTSLDNEDYEYEGYFKVEDCLRHYLLIRITNLKRKKMKKYHFGISTPWGSTPFIKKEYMMLERY